RRLSGGQFDSDGHDCTAASGDGTLAHEPAAQDTRQPGSKALGARRVWKFSARRPSASVTTSTIPPQCGHFATSSCMVLAPLAGPHPSCAVADTNRPFPSLACVGAIAPSVTLAPPARPQYRCLRQGGF